LCGIFFFVMLLFFLFVFGLEEVGLGGGWVVLVGCFVGWGGLGGGGGGVGVLWGVWGGGGGFVVRVVFFLSFVVVGWWGPPPRVELPLDLQDKNVIRSARGQTQC